MSVTVPPPTPDRTLSAVLDRLRNELEELSARIAGELHARFPMYRTVPIEHMSAQIIENTKLTLSLIEQRRLPSQRELELLTSVVEERAEQGFPLDLVLRANRVAAALLWQRAREVAVELGADPVLLSGMYEFEAETLAMTFIEAASVHRRVELATARAGQERLVATLQELLTVAGGPDRAAELGLRLGLDPAGSYRVIHARPRDGVSTARVRELLSEDREHRGSVARSVVVARGEDVVAVVTTAPPGAASPELVAGISAPTDLAGAVRAYESASRALTAARAFGLHGVHSVDDLGVRAAVAADPEVTAAVRARYIEPLDEAGAIRDDLLKTMKGYLDARMRRDAAAAAMHMHPNTLAYRVSKFVHLTGADLDDITTIVDLWWAFQSLEIDPES